MKNNDRKTLFIFSRLRNNQENRKPTKICERKGGVSLNYPPLVTTFHIARSVRRDYRTPAPHDWPSKFKRLLMLRRAYTALTLCSSSRL
jgi:hypothetical protein